MYRRTWTTTKQHQQLQKTSIRRNTIKHESSNWYNRKIQKTKLMRKSLRAGKKDGPTTPKFYPWPKIHKEGNPGRLVETSENCHTTNIPKYVDYHIQPIVKEIPNNY